MYLHCHSFNLLLKNNGKTVPSVRFHHGPETDASNSLSICENCHSKWHHIYTVLPFTSIHAFHGSYIINVKNCGFIVEHGDCPACRIYIAFVFVSNSECRHVCTVCILQSHYWICDEQGYIINNWNTTHTTVNIRKAVHYKECTCYLTHWGRVTQICVFYITTVQHGWCKSAFLTRACFPCTIHLIMQYIEPVSEWSSWQMFIETWPHSELTFRHRASSI